MVKLLIKNEKLPKFSKNTFVILSRTSLRKKCPYSELFWLAFSRIRTEYGEIQSISPYPVRMRENADQNNFEYEQFLRSVYMWKS